MKRVVMIAGLGVLAYVAAQIYSLSSNLDRVRSEDPLVWSEEIEAFANAAPGPSNALLFVLRSIFAFPHGPSYFVWKCLDCYDSDSRDNLSTASVVLSTMLWNRAFWVTHT